MPYKLPNTFQMQTPVGQAVSNMMSAYAENLPSADDEAKSAYLKAETAAAQQKLNAPSALGGIVQNYINAQQPTTSTVTAEAPRPSSSFVGPEPGVDTTTTTPGLDPRAAFRSIAAPYIQRLTEAGQLSQAGDVMRLLNANNANESPHDMAMAMQGAGNPYASSQEGFDKNQAMELVKARMQQDGENTRNANNPASQGGALGVILHEMIKSNPKLYPDIGTALQAYKAGFKNQTQMDENGNIVATPGALDTTTQFANSKETGKKTADLNVNLQTAYPKAVLGLKQTDAESNNLIGLIDKATAQIKANPNLNTGAIGALTKAIPGTPEYDLAQTLNSIFANHTLQALNNLKASSTSGSSGLGRVTNYEAGLLGNSIANVSQSQSPQQLLENLANARGRVVIMHGNTANAFKSEYGGVQGFDPSAVPGDLTGASYAQQAAPGGAAAQPGAAAPGSAPMTKVLNGVTYVNPTGQPNDWHSQ